MSEDTKSKLAEVRAKREALEAKREAAEEAAKAEAELADETAALAEAEALPELEAKHGRLGEGLQVVRMLTKAGRDVCYSVIVKTPDHIRYKRFAERGSDTTMKDVEQFVFPSVVSPERSTAARAFEAEPHALMRCANACAFLAGARKEANDAKH